MLENYTAVSRIKRFSKSVVILKNGDITLQFVEDDKYFKAYDKLFWFIEKSALESANIRVAYVDGSVISFLCRAGEKTYAMNYFLNTDFFERDSRVLRYASVKQREVKKAVSRAGERCECKNASVYPIRSGIAKLLTRDGEKCVKIRKE